MSASTHMAPDFLIVGIDRGDDGVMLLASRDLDECSLAVDLDPFDTMFGSTTMPRPPRTVRYDFTGSMRTVYVVMGATYPEALQRLVHAWNTPGGFGDAAGPDDRRLAAPTPAIEQAQL